MKNCNFTDNKQKRNMRLKLVDKPEYVNFDGREKLTFSMMMEVKLQFSFSSKFALQKFTRNSF